MPNHGSCGADSQEGYLAREVCPQCGACLAWAVLKVSVCCVDYGSLVNNATLQAGFEEGVVAGILSACPAGLGPEHVSLKLAPGSVVVFATVTPPPGVAMWDVNLALADETSITASIDARLAAIDGLREISSGPPAVFSVGTGKDPDVWKRSWSFDGHLASVGTGLPWVAQWAGNGTAVFAQGPTFAVSALAFSGGGGGGEGGFLDLGQRVLGGSGLSICAAFVVQELSPEGVPTRLVELGGEGGALSDVIALDAVPRPGGNSTDAAAVGGALRLSVAQSGALAQVVVEGFWESGAWVHVCATVDGAGVLSVYREGMLVAQDQGLVPRRLLRAGLAVGRGQERGTALHGRVAALLIADGQALTADEVLDQWLETERWRRAMTIDGATTVWGYSSAAWQGCTPFSSGGNTRSDYYCQDYREMALVFIQTLSDGSQEFHDLRFGGPVFRSLKDMFTGEYSQTNFGAERWHSLVSGAGHQEHCNREGFNVAADAMQSRCRLGLLMNDQDDCGSPDSYVGIGCEVNSHGSAVSAGAKVRLGIGDGDFPVQAEVWIQPSAIHYNTLGGFYCHPTSIRKRLSISALSLEHCQALCDLDRACRFINYYPALFWTASCYSCPETGWTPASSSSGVLYEKSNHTKTTTSSTMTTSTTSTSSTTRSTTTTSTTTSTSTSTSTTTTVLFEPFLRSFVGSANVFGYFEASPRTSYAEDFVRRLPPYIGEQTEIMAAVDGGACGGASAVIFTLGPTALDFLKDGVQGEWSDELRDVRVAYGNVSVLPSHIWMGGNGSNASQGWILAQRLGNSSSSSSTFASGYGGGAGWDYCNGNPLVGGEVVTLLYRVLEESWLYAPSDDGPFSATPGSEPEWTSIFRCRGSGGGGGGGPADRRLAFEPHLVRRMAEQATRMRICRTSGGAEPACAESLPGAFPVEALREGVMLSHPNGTACGMTCVGRAWSGQAGDLALMATYEGQTSFDGALLGDSPLFASEGTASGLALGVGTQEPCRWIGGTEEEIEIFLDVRVANISCPSGWSLLGTTCYRAFAGVLDRLSAASACFGLGAQLAKVDMSAASAALPGLVAEAAAGPAWIGASLVRGEALWSDGLPLGLGYQGWAAGRPSGQECVQIGVDGMWYDVLCSLMPMAYVCSLEAYVWLQHAASHCYGPSLAPGARPLAFDALGPARDRCGELGGRCWGVYDGGCDQSPGDIFLCMDSMVSSPGDLQASEQRPPSCVLQKLDLPTVPVTWTSTSTTTSSTTTTTSTMTTTVTTITQTTTSTLDNPVVGRDGPYNETLWANLIQGTAKEGRVSQIIGGGFSFAAAVNMTANPYGLSRLFDFSRSSGGPFNSDFADAIGVRSDLGTSLFFYMYGASGDNADALNYVEVPDAWHIGDEAMWLFTASTSGDLKVYKNGELLAVQPSPSGGALRYVHRPYLMVGRHPFYGQGWHGTISSVKVWDREVVWDEVGSCITFTCPWGWYNRTNKVRIFCKWWPCRDSDATVCCQQPGEDEFPNIYKKKRGCKDEVPINNLVASGFVDSLVDCHTACVEEADCRFFTWWSSNQYCNRYRSCYEDRYVQDSHVYKVHRPWQLAATINGENPAWEYGAEAWKDCVLFSHGADRKMKYYCDNFMRMRLVFRFPGGEERALEIEGDGQTSLKDLISGEGGGGPTPTAEGIDRWQSLLAAEGVDFVLPEGCHQEGFNVATGFPDSSSGSRCRLGVVVSNESSCDFADAYLGVGCEAMTQGGGRQVTAGAYNAHDPVPAMLPVQAELWVQISLAARLKVHTCDSNDADTSAELQIRFPGGSWVTLNHPGYTDFARNQWDTYQLALPSEPNSLSVRIVHPDARADDWCVDGIELGQEVVRSGLPRWFNSPCADPAIGYLRCSNASTFTFRPRTWCNRGTVGTFGAETVCCSSICGGVCADEGCYDRPGGFLFCCPTAIVTEGRTCSSYEDTACIINDRFGYFVTDVSPESASSPTCASVLPEAADLYGASGAWCCSDLDDSCTTACAASEQGPYAGFTTSVARCQALGLRLCTLTEISAGKCSEQLAACGEPAPAPSPSPGGRRRRTKAWTGEACDTQEFQGAIYTKSSGSMNVAAAREYCHEQGASVISVRTMEEHLYVGSAYCSSGCCHVGLVEEGGDAHTPPASQTWRWEDLMDKADFTPWDLGQPDNGGGVEDERNVIMTSTGKFSDVGASQRCAALCKRELDCQDVAGTYYAVPQNMVLTQDPFNRCIVSLRDATGTTSQWKLIGNVLSKPSSPHHAEVLQNGHLLWSDGNLSKKLAKVTCMFTADDAVDELYYNNEDKSSRLSLFDPGCETVKTLEFVDAPDAVLGIAVHDEDNGTDATKSFSLMCTASEPSSEWNFALNTATAHQHVRVYSSHANDPPPGWYQNSFPDHLHWDEPSTAKVDTRNCKPLAKYGAQQVWHGNVRHNFYRVMAEAVGPTTSTTTSTTTVTSTTSATTTTSSGTHTSSTTTSTTSTTTEAFEIHWEMLRVCATCVDPWASVYDPDVWLFGEHTLQMCQEKAEQKGHRYITFKPRSGLCKINQNCKVESPYDCRTCTTEYGSCSLHADAGYIWSRVEGVMLFDSLFVFDRTQRTFEDNVLHCHALGYRIASIHNDVEQAQVQALLTKPAYIGARSDADGTWSWVDATAWDYPPPNGSGVADTHPARLAMRPEDDAWYAETEKAGVVCRKKEEINWRLAYVGYYWDSYPDENRVLFHAYGSRNRGIVTFENADKSRSAVGTYNTKGIEVTMASGDLLSGTYRPGNSSFPDSISWYFGPGGAPWQRVSYERSCHISLSGHPDESYNGEYFLQETLANGQLWYRKYNPDRLLYYYDENTGGERRWALDYRIENGYEFAGYNDWYTGGWSRGTVMPMGTNPFMDPTDFYNLPQSYLNIRCGKPRPVDFVKVKPHFAEGLTYEQMDERCQERGARLASILSMEEVEMAKEVCTEGDFCYIGLRWEDDTAWRWADGSYYNSQGYYEPSPTSFHNFGRHEPGGLWPGERCVGFSIDSDGEWMSAPCPSGWRDYTVNDKLVAGICKVVEVTTTTSTTTMTVPAWPAFGAPKSRCIDGDDGYDISHKEACQAAAILLGHRYFIFSEVGGFGPTGALCATAETCEVPFTGTVLPWQIYFEGGNYLSTEFTTVTTTQDMATRKASAVLGLPCEQGGFASIACNAVVRAAAMYPKDQLEHIGVEEEECESWMTIHGSHYRSLIIVGPFFQKCLVASYRAHPTTRFTTVDFCHPPEMSADNVKCGEFQNTLPNLDWGFKGYSPSYTQGVPYQAKIDLVTSIAIKELARVRAR